MPLLARAVVVVLAPALIAAGCGGDGESGGGDTLAVGDTAVVEYAQMDDSGTPSATTDLAVTVTDVRQGTQADLSDAGFEVDSEDEDATPHYVDVRFENQGEEPLDRTLSVSLEGPDGETLPHTLVFDAGGKPFELCREVTEGTLPPGESYETCTLVLVPEGVEAETVLFTSQKADAEIVFTRWDASG